MLCHPFVIGEVACGNLQNREEVLELLRALPQAEVAENDEVLLFLDSHDLYDFGLGWIDLHLLASALLTGCGIWTQKRKLKAAAKRVGIGVL